jgi:hypothetical protein
MSTLYFFNLQVLPLNPNKHKLVGDDGYEKLFESLKNKIEGQKKSKTLHDYGQKIPYSELYFVPYKVSIEKTYVSGLFRKYDKVEGIKEFYTDKTIYSVPKGQSGSSIALDFRFVFDRKKHTLVIEDKGGKLPNTQSLQDLIYHFATDARVDVFPEYIITCDVLKEGSALENVYKAKGYRAINIVLTYSNARDTEEDLESLIDTDNKENGITRLKVSQSTEPGGIITGLPNYTKALINLASKYGNATMSYLDDKTNKWSKFSFKRFPVKISIRQSTDDKVSVFTKMHSKIKLANERAAAKKDA